MEDILDRAIEFAVRAHCGQIRKGSRSPYILHPLEAAVIVATLTDDREIMAAAVLHDTVEDTDTTTDDILREFGARVCAMVAHETENKREHLPAAETWRIRKEESLAALRESDDPAAAMLWMGDKLSNLRAISREYAAVGDAVFDRFNNKNPADHKWYYGTILELLAPLADSAAYKEYAALFHALFDRYDCNAQE